MLNRVSGSLLFAACFAVLLSLQGTGCSSSPGAEGDGGEDGPTSDATFPDGGPCPTGDIVCSSKCINPKNDPSNCGVCGATCGTNLVCNAGQCSLGCGDGGLSDGGQLTACSGGCFDLATDSNNCGTCGHACGSGQVCSGGACTQACGGSTLCNGACTDTNTDNANCGTCGTACSPGTICGGGKCSVTCLTGYSQCSGAGDAGAYCANTKSDVNNCGACGHGCAQGEVCNSGSCSSSCNAGLVNCNGDCIDPSTDGNYCGATTGCGVGDAGGTQGHVCAAGTACSSGTCSVSCTPPTINCSGSCVDPTSNDTYCGATSGCGAGDAGAAGSTCGAGQFCSNSLCASTCGNLLLCGGVCVDPNASTKYCGASGDCAGANSGTPCQAGQVCAGGVCQLTCSPGLINCNSTCIDPTSNNAFCGAMGNCQGHPNLGEACPPGFICSNGECELTCQAGFVDCNNQCVDPQLSLAYCGATSGCGVNGMGSAGRSCASGEVCSGTPPTCQTSCLTSEALCGGRCVNPQTDNGYCGAAVEGPPGTGTANAMCNDPSSSGTQYEGINCTHVSGERCSNGSCVCPASANPGSFTDIICDVTAGMDGTASCIDPSTDNTFCGATLGCGANGYQGATSGTNGVDCASTTGTGQTGSGASCGAGGTPGVCGCPSSGVSCGNPLTCINPDTSDQYCGAKASNSCAAASSPNDGTGFTDCSVIVGSGCGANGHPGVCECPSGQINCDGTCIDPDTNNQFCGATTGCGTHSVGSVGSNCLGTPVEGGIVGSFCYTATAGQTPSSATCVCSTTPFATGAIVNCTPSGGVPTCVDPSTNNEFCGATADVNGSCGTGGTSSDGSDCAFLIGSTCGGNASDPRTCSCPLIGSTTEREVDCQLSPSGGGPTGNPHTDTCIDPTTNNSFCGSPAELLANGCVAATTLSPSVNGFINCGNGGLGSITGSSCTATGSSPNVVGVCTCPSSAAGVPEFVCTQGAGMHQQQECVDPSLSNEFCGASAGCGVSGMGSAGTDCPNAIPGSVCSPTTSTGQTPEPPYGSCSTCPLSPSGVQEVICGGNCIDPSANSTYCGATSGCGLSGHGSQGTDCSSQYATGSSCTPSGSAPFGSCTCPSGQLVCNGVCVDPTVSTTNCGARGTCSDHPAPAVTMSTYSDPNFYGYACSTDPAFGAGYVCSDSTCQTTCQSGTQCGSPAQCTNTATDPNNCGACSTVCNSGKCSGTCQPATYSVGVAQLSNLGCTECVSNVTDCCASTFTLKWTDNGLSSVPPTQVQIQVKQGWSFGTAAMGLALNGTTAAETFTPTANDSCPISSIPATITLSGADLATYVIDGTNTLTFEEGNPNNCAGLNPISGNTYANVTVTFSPE